MICTIQRLPCPVTLTDETKYFPFPSGTAKSEKSCPFPAPFMQLDAQRRCCFELSNDHVWPKACDSVPPAQSIDSFCEDFSASEAKFQIRIQRDMKFFVKPAGHDSLDDLSSVSMHVTGDILQDISTRHSSFVPAGGLGVGLPQGYARRELVKAPRVSLLGYTAGFLLCAFLYGALLEIAAEQALIIEGKLREREFGNVSEEDSALEEGLLAEQDIDDILSRNN